MQRTYSINCEPFKIKRKGGMFNITAIENGTEITLTEGESDSGITRFTFNIEYSKDYYN